MITRRYPVLLWVDPAGQHGGAVAAELDAPAATGPSADAVLQQLRECIEWNLEHEPWLAEPDLIDPRLLEVRVDVRPQYQNGDRITPCPETLPMLVPCVTGFQESGLPTCIIPHFRIQFSYQEGGDLRSLVAHYVKESLRALSPSMLALRIPPTGCRLAELVLRQRLGAERVPPPEARPELKFLFTVADPLLQDRTRAGLASAAYEREELVQRLVQLLDTDRSSLLLVGEHGCGKSTVLLDAARRLSRLRKPSQGDASDNPRDLHRYRLWRGSGARLIAGMRYLGEWEERTETFITALSGIGGVFCAENLLELVSIGGQGPGNSVAAFLLPYLHRGELRMVAEVSPAELDACRRLLPGLLDAFQVVRVPEFSEAEVDRVLQRIADTHTQTAQLHLQPGTVRRIHRLFRRFQPYSAFPGPAATFIRTLVDRRRRAQPAGRELTEAHAIEAFVQHTGLPELFLRDDLPLDLEAVASGFAAQVVGQTPATRAASQVVARVKSGLNDPGRPLGVLLFCGPTGVGKTALARALVTLCFGASGEKDRLVRLDMSEYAGWGAARRLLLDVHGRPAPWLEQVRRQPFCVVLFDEIEKAAPEVFDVLLSLLDEGRVTDRFGRVTWFRSAIVILTSNLGAEASSGLGFGGGTGPDYAGEVARFFRPEFFNRLDEVIAFSPLSATDIENITRKELADLARREGLAAAHLRLAWSDDLVRHVARTGYDRLLGARPLQRTLEQCVATPIARWRVANPRPGPGTLWLALDDTGQVTLRHVPD